MFCWVFMCGSQIHLLDLSESQLRLRLSTGYDLLVQLHAVPVWLCKLLTLRESQCGYTLRALNLQTDRVGCNFGCTLILRDLNNASPLMNPTSPLELHVKSGPAPRPPGVFSVAQSYPIPTRTGSPPLSAILIKVEANSTQYFFFKVSDSKREPLP